MTPTIEALIKTLTTLVASGGTALIWIGGIYLVGKFATPVITAGVLLRGVRLIIREVGDQRYRFRQLAAKPEDRA